MPRGDTSFFPTRAAPVRQRLPSGDHQRDRLALPPTDPLVEDVPGGEDLVRVRISPLGGPVNDGKEEREPLWVTSQWVVLRVDPHGLTRYADRTHAHVPFRR